MEPKINAILEGLNSNRIINESVPKKGLKQGLALQLNTNMTIQYIMDKNNKDRADAKSNGKWDDIFLKELEKLTGGHMTISKSKTELKLTPECVIEVEEVKDGGKYCICNIGGDDNIRIYVRSDEYRKLDPYGSAPKASKEKEEVQYAIYGCPDIYGRADTQWHWTQKDDNETEKEFKAGVKYSAKRRAEQEYREYDPRSIKTMYFSSKDTFLKQCSRLGIKPKLED